jgi:hypothetical protein
MCEEPVPEQDDENGYIDDDEIEMEEDEASP